MSECCPCVSHIDGDAPIGKTRQVWNDTSPHPDPARVCVNCGFYWGSKK